MLKKTISGFISNKATGKMILLSVLALTVLVLPLVACAGPVAAPIKPSTPAFAVPPHTQAPATFQVTELVVNPVEVNPGERVDITATVANTGGTKGTYNAELKINNTPEQKIQIAVAAGMNQTLNFSTSRDEPGSYRIAVGELTQELTVKSVKPPQSDKPETTIPEPEVPSCCR